jgi:ABC-type multidrug transport system fused ATPase/permease subunit
MDKQENKLGRDVEDIEDLLKVIEKSYDIRFEKGELGHVRTFGQLTDHIISKIKYVDKEDCTDQQAFYKIRTIIERINTFDKSVISPSTCLTDIFARETRRKDIKKIEKELGLDLKALEPKDFVTYSILLLLLISIIGLFINWKFGLVGLGISIAAFWIADKTAKEFKDKTLGELIERTTQLNYAKARRQQGTVNKKEIQGKIRKLFIESLLLDDNEIDRDTVIV